MLAHVIDRANARVVQQRDSTSLPVKTFERSRVPREVPGRELQCNLAAEPRVFSSKYLPHAAAPERFEDTVVRDGFANHVEVAHAIVNNSAKRRKRRCCNRWDV
jgi:hypothetical protein